MKLRLLRYPGACALLALAFSACGEGPTNAPFSVEEEINANIPYEYITVTIDGYTYQYSGDEASSNHFHNSRAEHGMLILEMSDGDTNVFNLSTLTSIEIRQSSLHLRY